VKKDIEYLNSAVKEGRPEIVQTSLDFSKWLIAYTFDNKPAHYYFYDRKVKNAKFLFSTRQKLEGLKLSHMHGVEVKTRDGLTQLCYLSLPYESDPNGTGRPNEPVPMVLSVHGGPWHRDEWGMHQAVQLLTNRGYAVLQCNYRGSTGFGRKFHVAGYGEWAAKMHNDLIDAVNWAIKEKIAIRNKIAIEGGSYGGYAALVGLTFTPDVFACGVDEVGPSNLITLLETIPSYWKPAFNSDAKRIGGDPRTENGRKTLTEKSPITYASKIVKPLLIAQGANDPRVNRNESDQIVAELKKNNIPVTYLLYENEGHGFLRPENKMSYHALMEKFLSDCLGGRAEPITTEVKASSVKMLADSLNLKPDNFENRQ
jgi:dipeptidyl aminopeptidase/acylaminoacyl peptidase